MHLLPKNKNWKILLLKIAESLDSQELFPNESLTWIMSYLYSKPVFCVICSISLTTCWWKGSLVMCNLWKVYLLRFSTPCHLSIIILAFYYIFFTTCSQFLYLNVLQSLFTACLSYKYTQKNWLLLHARVRMLYSSFIIVVLEKMFDSEKTEYVRLQKSLS